ncbi:MAG: D-glycero-beta-D-manno-heptose-7-phosphate kinase [Elusimicrobia bacterium]|nr:D-glycero-beta-D-manno-heptose-7-phosphate kinase [Elusimicrobiota bacterium]
MSKYEVKSILKIIDRFPKTKILVIGDIIVDHFVWGKVSRLSPEAPVPVVEVSQESFIPGGSGNVAHNIAALKGQVFLCGVTGNDPVGSQITELIGERGVDISGVFVAAGIPTIQKTRIIANIQQVVRIDREDRESKDKKIISQILKYLKDTVPQVDAIIISDYGKGMINVPLLKEAIKLAHRYDKVITVDPKVEHFLKYKGVTCITPNHLEAAQGIHYPLPRDQVETEMLGEKIIRKLKCHSLLITQGEKGMTLFKQGKKPLHIPTMAREVFDVTGAGDTVISTLTMALAAGADLKQAAYIANQAAGIVVAKVGTATCSPEELKENLIQDKAGLKI